MYQYLNVYFCSLGMPNLETQTPNSKLQTSDGERKKALTNPLLSPSLRNRTVLPAANEDETSLDHGYYGPGWILSGGFFTKKGLRSSWNNSKSQYVQHRANRPSLSGSAHPWGPFISASRRSIGLGQSR